MKQKSYVYRIKDLNTSTYYKSRQTIFHKYPNDLKNGWSYKYDGKSIYGSEYTNYLYFDNAGHFYPTKKGAERIVSELTQSSKHQRTTPAGRLLNCKFNFVVVKSELKLKDVEDKE